MDWAGLAVWTPTAAVVALATIAGAGAIVLPERPMRRRYGLLAALLCGGLAIAATAWQQRREAAAVGAEREEAAQAAETRGENLAKLARRLHVAWQLFDAASAQLPALPGAAPPALFDTADAGFAALAAESDALAKRIKAFQDSAQGRSIDDTAAAGLVAYLQPRSHGRVVVSCVPNDEEAYLYANRIATILRQAGWEAVGPEFTAIFGKAPAIAVGLYVRGGEPPDAARVLVEAFTRFNIPYQSRIASNEAIPDKETVELFVGKKP